MKTTILTLALALTSLVWIDQAPACGGGGGGHHGSFNYGNYKHTNFKHRHHDRVIVKKVYVYPECYHPSHGTCFVLPGDTYATIALREYGNAGLWRNIANFNGMSCSMPPVVGRQLALPVINRDGSLVASPAAPATMINAAPAVEMSSEIPAAQIRLETATTLPSVPTGSVLNLEGRDFGAEAGTVRLRISGLILPVEVITWEAGAAKVRMPSVELAEAVHGEIEVLRADGSLASKSAIRLVPATDRLAMGN